MNLKMFLVFLIISSSPIKDIASPNIHLDERDARIFNCPHCFFSSFHEKRVLWCYLQGMQGVLLGGL